MINAIYKIESKKNKFYQRILLHSYIITLKVNGTWEHNILNAQENFYSFPSEIYIDNNEIQNFSPPYKITVCDPTSIIKLEWNYPPNSTRSLFGHCSTITEINLTNFDSSSVIDMRDTFWDCFSLTSIDLSNLKTENVIDMWGFFIGCNSLRSLDLKSFNTSKVTSLVHMFENGYSLISLDLSNFDTYEVTEMTRLFHDCKNLEYINLKNFIENENKNVNSEEIFTGIAKNAVICLNPIKVLTLYNIAKNMVCVTISCKENWRSVQKKIVIGTEECIDDCNSSSNKYEYNGKCYSECPEDTINYNYKCYSKEEKCDHNCKTCMINSNFIISSNCTTCYSDQFLDNGKCVDNCSNGYYYDELDPSIKKCKCDLIKCKSCTNESLTKNLCISCNEEYNYYPILNDTESFGDFINCNNETIPGYYFDDNDKYYKKCYISCSSCKEKGNHTNHNCLTCASDYIYNITISGAINCYQSCPKIFSKLIPAKKLCIDDCSKDNDYKYEFRNKCYRECPYNISQKSEVKNFYCEAQCSKEYPFEIVETQLCVNNCTISERQNGICKINYISNNENNKEAEEKFIDNIKEELTKDFNASNIDKGEDVTIVQKGSTITITTTENQKKDKSYNTTTINLGECENKIKEEYNISKNKSLYILKIDVNQEGFKIPKIEYEVYYPLFGNALIKLNLTACKDSKIDLSIPIVITESLDKINQSSGYYNDICYTFTSEDGTDISLSDRKKEFLNNNLTICEENCDFTSYNNVLEKATCSCKVKTNSSTKIGDIIIDKDRLFKSFTDIKNILNVKILRCYKLIFKSEAYKYNYANIVMLIIILLFIVTFIIFCFKGYSILIKIINIIEFLKLNPKIKKKFLKKQRKKENKNISNPIKKKKTQRAISFISNIRNSKHKSRNKNYDKNKDEIKENEKQNNNRNNNIIMINSLPTGKTKKNKKNNPYNLNKKQLYEIFLKINEFTDEELNNFSYKKALQLDNRTYWKYYVSLVRTKHLLFFSFWHSFDYNSRILKIYLFLFNFTVSFFVNALFFNDETMHKIYEEKGSFNFIYNIPQILYSSTISGFINGFIQVLALTDSNIIEFKQKSKKRNAIVKKEETVKKIKIKLIFFFLVNLILLIFFWFYLSCFSAVYKNTQIHLIKDTVISFGTSMISPLAIYTLPGIFRFGALKSEKKDRELMFKFSKILQLL